MQMEQQMNANTIATQISRATLTAADFELILSALASKVRDTFNNCATDDAVESLDMAAEHINGLREFTHEERRAHTWRACDCRRDGWRHRCLRGSVAFRGTVAGMSDLDPPDWWIAQPLWTEEMDADKYQREAIADALDEQESEDE